MAHASQYTVHTAGVDELRASQVEWAPLVAAMRYPTVFCGWEWIYTWWEHFSAGYDLRLLMVRRDGQLRAILPLFSEQRLIRWDGRLGRVLGYCGVPYLYPDPVDVIGAEADVRECVRAIIDHLRTD